MTSVKTGGSGPSGERRDGRLSSVSGLSSGGFTACRREGGVNTGFHKSNLIASTATLTPRQYRIKCGGGGGGVPNLSVSQQVGRRAGVEQRGEDVANAALELPLQRRPPLGRVALGAFGASVGHAVWQLGEQLVHFV